MKKGLALFDFDGTITSKDSLLEFIKFSVGKLKFLMVMGLFSPFIFYYVFLIKKGETAKMMVLSYLFKNKTEEQMISMGLEFAQKVIPQLVLPNAINEINEFKKRGDRLVVISASLDIWLKPWTDEMGIELLSTKMEFKGGKFTGRFATPNCVGDEKVTRIKDYLDIEDYRPIYAYGNSSGDQAMLNLADHRYYKKFN